MPAPVLIKTTPMSYRFPVTEGGFIPGYPFSVNQYVSPFIEYMYNASIRRWVVDKKYRYYNSKTKELYLPAYDLPRFINRLQTMEIPYRQEALPLTLGKSVEIPIRPGMAPRDEQQVRSVEYLSTDTSPTRGLAIQTGKGKALTLNTPVKVPGGWTTMGEIKLGDKVIAWNGTPTTVVGVYPQGVTKTYRVTFDDGRYVDTCGEHLWRCFYINTSPHRRWRIRTTLEIQRLISMPNPRVYIPLSEPEVTPQANLPIDPYVFGYMLGNGNMSSKSVGFSTRDVSVVEEIKKELPDTLKVVQYSKYNYQITKTGGNTNHYVSVLRSLGVMGKYSYEKEIPNLYMNGSIEQSWALIQGLMDSDGTAEISGSCSFCTTSKVMAEQVQYIIRALGGIASIRIRHPHYTYLGIKQTGRRAYEVDIRVKTPERLFRLSRKQKRVSDKNQYAEKLKLRVVSVVRIEDQSTQCITVAHLDSMFVVKDFIVTHNTSSLLFSLSRIGRRAMIVLPGFIGQWQRSIEQFTTLTDNDVYLIQGQPSLFKLMAGIDKKIFPKIILCSIGTLRNYCLDKDSFVNCPSFDRLCEVWDVGVRAIDEAHLNFHANLMMDLRLTPAVNIYLTATFDSSKPNIKTIFDNHYPVVMRYGEDEYHRYVDIYGYAYRTGVGDIPAHVYRGANGYSQIKWENWLLTKGKYKLRQITEDVYIPLIRSHYITLAQPGEKCLILCETVEMCKFIQNEVASTFPDYSSAIYVEGTPDTVLDTTNIIVSTTRSAGAGRDIKNLLAVFVTTSVRSAPLNEQMLGRLRVLPGRTPQFVYMWNISMPSHVSHAMERAQIFRPLAKEFHSITLP